jgi:hypothetical protein
VIKFLQEVPVNEVLSKLGLDWQVQFRQNVCVCMCVK